MKPSILVRPSAWREIDAQLNHLEEQAGLETAERFLDQLLRTLDLLATMPKIGAPCGLRRAKLRNIRRWPIEEFEDWLIFYLPENNAIDVVHVMHGARDFVEGLLNTKS